MVEWRGFPCRRGSCQKTQAALHWGSGHPLAKERERKGDIIRYVYVLRAEFLS